VGDIVNIFIYINSKNKVGEEITPFYPLNNISKNIEEVYYPLSLLPHVPFP